MDNDTKVTQTKETTTETHTSVVHEEPKPKETVVIETTTED